MEAFYIEEKINNLLTSKFQEAEFQDCFLVGLALHENNKLELFIDSDSGITFEKCKRISRYLEAIIEEENWLGERYTLDVSSPGLSRPLKLLRQYRKNIGRQLEVTMDDGSAKTGLLKKVEDASITLEETVVVKEGNKKKKMEVEIKLPFEKIKKTLVVISFK